MPSFGIMYRAAVLIMILMLSGCSEVTPPPDSRPNSQPEPTLSHFDKLLSFGAAMSAMSDTSRTELCKSLNNTQQLLYSDDVQLQLMVGRLLSDACGSIPKILEGIQTLNPAYASDERMQKLIAIHTQILSRIQQAKKASPAKQKKGKPATESKEEVKTKEMIESNPDETHLLRKKLEAIRSMEKQLDENMESN